MIKLLKNIAYYDKGLAYNFIDIRIEMVRFLFCTSFKIIKFRRPKETISHIYFYVRGFDFARFSYEFPSIEDRASVENKEKFSDISYEVQDRLKFNAALDRYDKLTLKYFRDLNM